MAGMMFGSGARLGDELEVEGSTEREDGLRMTPHVLAWAPGGDI